MAIKNLNFRFDFMTYVYKIPDKKKKVGIFLKHSFTKITVDFICKNNVHIQYVSFT